MNPPAGSIEIDTLVDAMLSGVDYEYEGAYGISGSNMFALFANRHMYEFGTTREQLADVAVKNKYHGSLNPYAQKQRIVKKEKNIKITNH